MAKDIVVPNQGIRERHLNILYFVDSSRSHSIRINLALARWLLSLSIGLILWSLLSVGWIISLGHILAATRSHLDAALSSIFKYQVKYDQVFELAYPDNPASVASSIYSATDLAKPKVGTEGNHAPAKGDGAPANGALTQSPKSEAPSVATQKVIGPPSVNTSSSTTKALPIAEPATSQTAAIQLAANKVAEPIAAPTEALKGAAKPPTTGLSMDIRNLSLTANNGVMTLLFDISNSETAKKAEGYIWAIATLELGDGSSKKVAAPMHSRLNANGNIDAYSSTYKFSIQKFKRKDFAFIVPKDESWKVKDLKITYVDAQGHSPKTTPVMVPVQFSKITQETSPENGASLETATP
ncbi:MAG: hypothetical protein NTV34_15600 [Proteobacteria bacterium]|nr:hypothetical protein [Pseudomonadota bacterium]